MIRGRLAAEVGAAGAALLDEAGVAWPAGLEVQVTQPARLEHGDYTTNLPLQLARHARRPPMELAEALAARLAGLPLVARAEAARPGHLNVFLDWRSWAALPAVPPPPPERAQTKLLVEHTSINPNKAAHVGHLRNACLGDTLARLLRRAGYRVEVCNYVDDLGNQVADTVVGLLDLPTEGEHDRFGDFCWDVYARVSRAYREGALPLGRRRAVLEALEGGRTNVAWIGAVAAERIVREHLEDMAAFGVAYDLLVWEGDVVRGGFWETAFARLRRSPLVRLETEGRYAGCWLLAPPATLERDPEADVVGEADGPAPELPADLLEAERALLRHLAAWPDTLEEAAAELSATTLATYAYDLAWLFSRFYDAAPVLTAPAPRRAFRLWVVARARATLADALGVIGLPAPVLM